MILWGVAAVISLVLLHQVLAVVKGWMREEGYLFPWTCPSCGLRGQQITACQYCGYLTKYLRKALKEE